MKLVVGLGNPGTRYANTRHNVGFLAVEAFAKAHGISIEKKGYRSFFGKGTVDAVETFILEPQTFMNNSGEAVTAAVDRIGFKPADMLVVCDDVNLDVGIIRLRPHGSAGGHNGLSSIIECLADNSFARLRIGVGSPAAVELKEYVLADFKSGERKRVRETLDVCVDAIGVWVTDGIQNAMNRFNEKNPGRPA